MAATNLFDLTGRVAVITGGAGLLGIQHAKAIHAYGGIPVLADLDVDMAQSAAKEVGDRALGVRMDVTRPDSIGEVQASLIKKFGRVDILINNAARNPKVEAGGISASGRLEDVNLDTWNLDLAVGLTGAMLCSRFFGEQMASARGGVILNIASDLGLIGPNQSLYEKDDVPAEQQPRKPASYSVVKSGLIGLTRYLATYWADRNVRVNALCPGGVDNNTPSDFEARISKLIPMGRLARVDEYQGAIVFLCSDASSYMNGAVVSIDGGRTAW